MSREKSDIERQLEEEKHRKRDYQDEGGTYQPTRDELDEENPPQDSDN